MRIKKLVETGYIEDLKYEIYAVIDRAESPEKQKLYYQVYFPEDLGEWWYNYDTFPTAEEIGNKFLNAEIQTYNKKP